MAHFVAVDRRAFAPAVGRSMPWVFIVDDNGVVRAKDQGVLGSADVDVILSLLAAED